MNFLSGQYIVFVSHFGLYSTNFVTGIIVIRTKQFIILQCKGIIFVFVFGHQLQLPGFRTVTEDT